MCGNEKDFTSSRQNTLFISTLLPEKVNWFQRLLWRNFCTDRHTRAHDIRWNDIKVKMWESVSAKGQTIHRNTSIFCLYVWVYVTSFILSVYFIIVFYYWKSRGFILDINSQRVGGSFYHENYLFCSKMKIRFNDCNYVSTFRRISWFGFQKQSWNCSIMQGARCFTTRRDTALIADKIS